MKLPICTRCKKNVAVVFISKMDPNTKNATEQEGLCLKCAKEMELKPLNDIMDRMGITDDTLDMLSNEIGSMDDLAALMPVGQTGEDDEELFDDEDDDPVPNPRSSPFAMLRDLMSPEREWRVVDSDASRKEQNSGAKQDKKSEKKADKNRRHLQKFCTDLTARAREGRIDRIIGRETETDRVIQILNRRQKNNPCLIGEPGVGKTAIAEGLALRIVQGNVPAKLRGKELHLLDLTGLVAGTQFRGQFESRVKGLIDEVKVLGNIILVIDEVHNIVGAGESEGAMNAANILKPALSRGEIQVIGATTYAEYRKYIEKDGALERRFQPVTVTEPSVAETAAILRGVRGYYETYHGISIPDEVCDLAASLSERYITDRCLPDKAIDLIDEAGSRLNLDSPFLSEIPALEDEWLEVIEAQEDMAYVDPAQQDYAKLAEYKSRALQLESRIDKLRRQPAPVMGAEHLAAVIELWTGVPASKVQAQELRRLTGMEERLAAHVIGQREAIDAVCAAIRRSRAGISPKRKPVSFLFVGATGIGKTELVKTLAADLFDSPEALIRLDMSEYMEKHTVSRLIGSPPGYVGYDEAGQLTEKIRRRPYSVILLDEIEKAHPDVLNILLQILDDGRLTDAHGRTVNFENAVLVMTSNAGSEGMAGALGFGSAVQQQGKERALKALESILRPEFINRIDEIISFNQLTEDDFTAIAALRLGELRDSMDERNLRLTWDDRAVAYLVRKSYSSKLGARNLRRLIEKELETALAERIIAACDSPLLGAHVSADDEKLLIETI